MKDFYTEEVDITRKATVSVDGEDLFNMEYSIPSGAAKAKLGTTFEIGDFIAAHLKSWSLPIPANRESVNKRIKSAEVIAAMLEIMTDGEVRGEIEGN